MTVGVAAIWGNAMIWGASDRLLHHADTGVSSEPDTPKFRQVDRAAVVIFAGDTQMQSVIIDRLTLRIDATRRLEGFRQLAASEIAEAYKNVYDAYRGAELSRDLSTQTRESLTREFDTLEAIIAGLDPPSAIYSLTLRSASLYVFRNGALDGANDVGYAVIGVGRTEAERVMRRSGHTATVPFNPDTQYLVYRAKKAAEECRDAGQETDMFGISIMQNAFSHVPTDRLQFLEGVYRRQVESERLAESNAIDEVRRRLAEEFRAGDEKARKTNS